MWAFDDGTWARLTAVLTEVLVTTLQDGAVYPANQLGILELLASPTELMSQQRPGCQGSQRQAPCSEFQARQGSWEASLALCLVAQGGVIRPSIWLLHGGIGGGGVEDPLLYPQASSQSLLEGLAGGFLSGRNE